MPTPKYPNIIVELSDKNGNVFNLMALCTQEMKRAGLTKEEQEEFRKQMMHSDYDNAIITCLNWFTIE